MQHTLKKIDKNQTELLVELAREDLEVYIDRAEFDLGKDLQIDGFRKGKIPKDQLRKNIDPQEILQVALDAAIKASLAEVIGLEELDVLDTSKLEVKENTPDKLIYKVVLTLFPEVKIEDFSDIKVPRRSIEVAQKEIDNGLIEVRTSRANMISKDGIAEAGDRVEVDFEVRLDGQVIEGGISKNHPLTIGKKNFIPGFEKELEGMKKDQERSFSLVAPKDYYLKSIAGKKLDFTVKMGVIKSVTLPELNDDFAKSLGKFEDLAQLTTSIKEGIMEEKKLKEKQRIRLEILERVINQSSIIVPETLLSRQLDVMLKNLDNDLHANGMELGLYLAHIGQTQDELRSKWRGEAERQVKTALILHKISKTKNISASPEEIEDDFNTVAQSIMMSGQVDGESLDIQTIKDNITNRIVNEKVLQLLEDTCST